MDSYACSEWIAQEPPGLPRDHAAASLVRQIANEEPNAAWEWAKTVAQPELRKKVLQQAFTSMESQDPSAANTLLQDPGLSQEDLQHLTPQS